MVHGQADPDFDPAEAFSSETEGNRSAVNLERDFKSLTHHSQAGFRIRVGIGYRVPYVFNKEPVPDPGVQKSLQ